MLRDPLPTGYFIMRNVKTVVGVGLAATAMAMASPVLAHAHLVKSDPKANAVVHTGPKSITLTFSERLAPSFSKFVVSMPQHKMMVPVKTAVSRDGKRIVGTFANRLGAGAYIVTWTAASSDGHKMSGDVTFKVG
jgi:methionine-rich copper-binding protein CopC